MNNATDGPQTPWESSSLTSDFYFFGDTAVAASRAPDRRPIVQTAANLPSRSVRQAYDYVLSEGSPEYYEEFIRLYPHDPLCDHIRVLLGNLVVAKAWHKAVLANSPFAYKTFHDNYSNSPYATAALKLHGAPKAVPLMQFTHLAKQSPSFKPALGTLVRPQPDAGGANGPVPAYARLTCPRHRRPFAQRQHGQDGPDARQGQASPSTPAIPSTPARSRECPAGSTTIRCGSATGTWSTPAPRRFGGWYGRTLQPTLLREPVPQSFARGSFGGGPFIWRRFQAALTGELRTIANRAEHTLCPISFKYVT